MSSLRSRLSAPHLLYRSLFRMVVRVQSFYTDCLFHDLAQWFHFPTFSFLQYTTLSSVWQMFFETRQRLQKVIRKWFLTNTTCTQKPVSLPIQSSEVMRDTEFLCTICVPVHYWPVWGIFDLYRGGTWLRYYEWTIEQELEEQQAANVLCSDQAPEMPRHCLPNDKHLHSVPSSLVSTLPDSKGRVSSLTPLHCATLGLWALF